MTHQTLAEIWYLIWAFLWGTYFTFESYIVGTGILFPFLAKKKEEEAQLKKSIGPFWDSNEVWLVVAGGATLASFPKTYATLLSSFYIPFYLVLFALILRGPGIEFMDKLLTPSWRKKWIWVLCISSFFIPLLFGTAFSAIFSGLPIDETGLHLSFFDVINVYSLLGGITFTILTLLSGSLWISYKTLGKVHEKAARVAKKVWGVALLLVLTYFFVFINFTTLFDSLENAPLLWSVPALCVLALFISIFPLRKKKWLLSFAMVSFAIFTLFASGFTGMYPDMLPSFINPKYSLTLYDASASQFSLTVMLWAAGLLLPLIITYKIWIYWIFKDKITEENAHDY